MPHKPKLGPDSSSQNGIVNGLHMKSLPRNRARWIVLAKFLLGILGGLLLAGQLRHFLIPSSACVPFKLSPVHRQLKVKTPERTEVEAKSRQLLLVGVMTAEKYIGTRARAVYETWGHRVPGKILFFTSDSPNSTDDLPVIRLRGVDDSYPPQKKSFMMLKYMYENYGDKYEWFMRADDDVFIRTDRLELFLRNVNSSKARFIGQAGKGILVYKLTFCCYSNDWSHQSHHHYE